MSNSTCRWPECDRPAWTRGFCGRDYARAKRVANFDNPWLTPRQPVANSFHTNKTGPCVFAGCGLPKSDRDWCHKHYVYLHSRGELPVKACKGCGEPCPGRRHYCSDDCKRRCSISGCSEPGVSRGWCTFHYGRWESTGDASTPPTREWYSPGQLCEADGCDLEVRRNKLCETHSGQFYKTGKTRPIAHRTNSNICAFCGGPSGIRKGFRKVCSPNCAQMLRNHGGPIPDTYECILCKEQIPIMTKNGIRRKHTTKKCLKCRRNSMKHGYSAAQLAKRDGNECRLCSTPVDMTLVHPDLMRGSVDHIMPTSLGGSNEPENVWLAHLHCNIKKNNRVDVAV